MKMGNSDVNPNYPLTNLPNLSRLPRLAVGRAVDYQMASRDKREVFGQSDGDWDLE